MRKFNVKTFVLLAFAAGAFAQNSYQIKGSFLGAKEKEIRVMGFTGTKDTLLSQTVTDALGNFTLSYGKSYSGAANIQVKELSNLIVLLNKENVSITWADFKDFNSVQFSNSKENAVFQKAFQINLESQKRLAGLNYLMPLYQTDTTKTSWHIQLEKEAGIERSRFSDFQKKVPGQLYTKSYLQYREVLQLLQQENKTDDEATTAATAFLALDFSTKNLYHSGLIKECFEAYFKQVFKLDNKNLIIKELLIFTDTLKRSAQSNPMALNNYTEYLVHQFEKYGIIEVAEHLALSLLDDNKCVIDSKTLPILEQYKKMALGNTAAVLVLHNQAKYKTSADIKAKYQVVVFGASWCEACQSEMPQLKDYADTFKKQYDAEIVFISIDTKEAEYKNYTKDFPFISSCDYKGWEGENVKNYYVFATPTFIILDSNRKIVAKPSNAIAVAKWLYDNK